LSTFITIVVTAQNGTQKTYAINVSRAALGGNNNLSTLTVRAGTENLALTPPFPSNTTTTHTVNVASDVGNVTVTATKSDPNAVISGDVPNSGQANITLTGAGTTTRVSINVTAPNGDVKPYTIDVIRAAPAAPPKPASAPDLITADDTCPSGIPPAECAPDFNGNPTSKEDNVTTVTTPRFTIPQPGPGETPNLYVDGIKVDSDFDQGARTLQPKAALSGSNVGVQHSITSTVTNTATTLESNQSDALTVTISTGQSGV
jgi:hypothetical protein